MGSLSEKDVSIPKGRSSISKDPVSSPREDPVFENPVAQIEGPGRTGSVEADTSDGGALRASLFRPARRISALETASPSHLSQKRRIWWRLWLR